jgi:ABC-2 type transport system permease protein
MRGLFAVAERELMGLFLAPLAWILLCLTLFYNAFFFLLYLERSTGGDVDGALLLLAGGDFSFWILTIVLPPLVTMRMISEESRSGVLEFLLTAPVEDWAVVAGKALAATLFLSVVWACAPLYGLVCALLGAAPDWGQVLVAWLGTTAVSGLFAALGLLASAVSSTPLVAATLAIIANIFVVFLPILAHGARGIAPELLGDVVRWLDVKAHMQGSFLTGALDSGHLVFFAAWTLALLFLAVRAVEARRWL